MSGSGKQPQKNEENFSKVKEKVQRIFGFGKPSVPQTLPKTLSKEIIFTPEILKEIGPESPANNRLRTIRELCEVVRQKRLEDNAVEALWGQISDLIQPHVPRDSRHLALRFLQCLLEGQLDYLTVVRAHFFRVIQNLTDPQDMQHRLHLFETLTECGKNVLYFEEESSEFLLRWMPEVMSAGHISTFLSILVNLVKYNAAYVDEEVMAGLLQQTCMIPNRSRNDEELKKCLCILDAVLCYSYLPSNSLYHFVAALCHTVDKAPCSEMSWDLMRKLLGTFLGHSAIFTMCCMLQDKRQPVDILLLRGAIFFTGMALWGSRRVHSLKHTHASVLPSFLQALSHKNGIVAYEVILSIHRLVNKYGKDLQPVTWEIILDILETLITQIDTCQFEPKVDEDTQAVIGIIEGLHTTRQFFGPTARFFNIVEMCAHKRPPKSVCTLMDYHSEFIHPGREHWIRDLNTLMDKYLRHETRTEVRKKALEILSLTLSINTHLYERELIEGVVLPHFSHFACDPDPEVRCKAAEMLLGLCEDCHSNEFFELTLIIEKIIRKPLNVPPEAEGDEGCLMDSVTTVKKIIEVFKVKLYTAPASHCQKLYELLVAHLTLHYEHLYLGSTACHIRKAVFHLLLLLRADGRSRVGLADRKPGDRHVYSPYVMCRPCEDMETLMLKSPSVPGLSPSQIYAVLDYEHTFRLYLRCLEMERDWPVLQTVLQKLSLVLENKTLVLSACTDSDLIDALCGKLCSMVKDRTVEQSKKFINKPAGFTRSDFHAFVFPVLASMVTYHTHLDRARQRELVTCLEFGLVSRCAKICVTTLRICSLELQDLMMRMLSSVLLSLSKISATISMAIPVLAFLSSIVRIPKLYANFVEDQYMSVFAIALPYTNPFKFSHYTVSLAHHVIGIWFIRCRLPFRRGFVKYIQRGLKSNVLQLFEENSIRNLSSHNQGSADRGRTASLSEGNSHRRFNVSALEGVRNDGRVPMDEKMSQFHKELTETCMDMMARYAFGNYVALPKRTPMAQFLLQDGQRGMWVVGHKIVTVTTSGGGVKSTNSGLCDKCLAATTAAQNPAHSSSSSSSSSVSYSMPGGAGIKRSAPVATPSPSSAGRDRRRHKSLGRAHTQSDGLSMMPEEESLLTRRRCRDDMSLPLAQDGASSEVFDQDDVAVQTGSSLTTSGGLDAFSMEEPRGPAPSTPSAFSGNQCSCWCTSWAEVNIRGASGVVTWMMRIENQASSPTYGTDPSYLDITRLLAPPVRCRSPDSDSVGKIDSGSLCEEEYESLHLQHFSGPERSLFQDEHPQAPVPDESPPPAAPTSPQAQESTPGDAHSPSILRRISSSPSILSDPRSPQELMHDLATADSQPARSAAAPSSRMMASVTMTTSVTTVTSSSLAGAVGSSKARRDAEDFSLHTEQGLAVSERSSTDDILTDKKSSELSVGKRSDLSYRISLDKEMSGPGLKGTSTRSLESSENSVFTQPSQTGHREEDNFPQDSPSSGRRPLVSSSSEGKVMGSSRDAGSDKKVAQRSRSEDFPAGKKRPEALPLSASSRSRAIDVPAQAPQGQSPDSSSLSSLQDEVPELRQLKRRGHTISVMSPASDSPSKPRVGGLAEDSSDPDRLKGAGGEGTNKDGKTGLNPSYVFLQLYHNHPMVQSHELPLRVPDNEKFRRTIDRLDHIYPYETHKIGVLYMGKGQASDEKTLLANESGSWRYTQFLEGLGQMVLLEEAERDKVYLGGLTPSDGKFTVAWQDESLRMIFHIATLMPSDPGDTRYNNKKRHIGNDFVTIVYNDSSEDYKIGTISGQFNFVSIVIRPLDHESNAVTLLTKEVEFKDKISADIADILGHTHTKIISDANLPLLVRQIAVHCNLASMVLQRQQSTVGTPEVFASNWLERLRQIKLLKRRIAEHQQEEENQDMAGPSHAWPPPTGASGDMAGSLYEDFTDYL